MADLSKHSTFLVIDELGIDPLRDKAIDAVMQVEASKSHTVTQAEQHNAPLIAFNAYRNENYWWHIMVYNGIDDMWELKAGMKILIPNMNELIARLTKATKSNQTKKTVSI